MKSKLSSSNPHSRNLHLAGYDFSVLVQAHPTLSQYVRPNAYGAAIDFANQQTVKVLNQALLKQYYGVAVLDISKNYLSPPIPGRADYVHYLADLLAESIPKPRKPVIAKY